MMRFRAAMELDPHQLQSTEIYPMSILHAAQHPVSESINAANGTVFFHGLSNSSMSSLSSSIVGELINHEPVMGSGEYGTFGNDIGFGLQYSGGKSRAKVEKEAQFSNLCIACWSPLDLSPYEPSSSRPSAGRQASFTVLQYEDIYAFLLRK
ncbi:hypothetical protein Ancab_032317 [Ancistrocladus abbreviatus]